ncbi:MAG TPA: hypothetical protein PKA10_12440 [Selenomonadales bacterium]|nr:hypothetical protein [Selenomonadales bacterium]
MHIHRRLIALLVIVMVVVIAGCAGQQKPAPNPAPGPANMKAMEDPVPLINQMNQAADDVAAKAKANQLPQARQSSSNLISLNDRLAPNFSDTAFRDNLHHAIQSLNDEVNKPTPNPAEVDKGVQTVKGLLQQAPNKVMKM